MNKAIFLSDLHIASKKCKAKLLSGFLDVHNSQHTYLVGDVIDIWRFQQSFGFSKEKQEHHVSVISKLLNRASHGNELHYIYGNHDEFLSKFTSSGVFGNIHLHERCEYISSDNKKYLVIHGHQFDILSKYNWNSWVGKLGDRGYDVLIEINELYNNFRSLLGLKYFSLSKLIKIKVKKAAYFISNFEHTLTEYAKTHGYDGVICGHIHDPKDKIINGIHYLNCGCWTDKSNLTYLVDTGQGGLSLQTYKI